MGREDTEEGTTRESKNEKENGKRRQGCRIEWRTHAHRRRERETQTQAQTQTDGEKTALRTCNTDKNQTNKEKEEERQRNETNAKTRIFLRTRPPACNAHARTHTQRDTKQDIEVKPYPKTENKQRSACRGVTRKTKA